MDFVAVREAVSYTHLDVYKRQVLDGILTLPLVLPPTVAGFFLLYIFGVKRPVGQFFLDYFGVKIAFSWSATVIAAVVRCV